MTVNHWVVGSSPTRGASFLIAFSVWIFLSIVGFQKVSRQFLLLIFAGADADWHSQLYLHGVAKVSLK